MAELNQTAGRWKRAKQRVVKRAALAVAGDRISNLQRRLEVLEAEVQECRQLNLRLAEITDVVEQLLVPIAQQDRKRIDAALEKYSRTV